MVAGLVFPRVAAAFGALAIVGRYMYATGYSKAPKQRMRGFGLSQLSLASCMFMSFYVVYNMVR